MSIALTYLGGFTEVHIPDAGVTVARGGSALVPDEIAGREPGDWRPATREDLADGPGGFTPKGWPLHLADDATWWTRDPGEGLLAQHDTWIRTEPLEG